MIEITIGEPLPKQVGPQQYKLKAAERGVYRIWVSDDKAKISVSPADAPDNPILEGESPLEGLMVAHNYIVKVYVKKNAVFEINTSKV